MTAPDPAMVKRALARFQAELDRTAPEIGKILEADERERIMTGAASLTPVHTDGETRPVPNSPKTPHRTIRVDDELWDASIAAAAAAGTTVSEVIREALRAYLATRPKSRRASGRASRPVK